MKILFVNEKCGYYGGVEQNVADTAEALRGRGHACFLAYGHTTERDAEQYQARFDGCWRCPELACEDTNGGGRRFAEVLRHTGADVVYFHKVPELTFCESLLSGIRAVRMVHDHDLCCPRRHKYFALTGRVCRHKVGWRCWGDAAFLVRDCTSRLGLRWNRIARVVSEMRRNYRLDTLLVGSRFMRDELVSNGFPEENVHILPPVVRMADPGRQPVPEQQRVLYVGQLVRGKGVDLLLRALAQVSCEFTATLVGSGNAEAKLRRVCRRLGLSDRVKFAGWVDHESLSPFYAAAKVVAVPSRWPEPFGMTGLEAMHHGRAVVAFATGGIPDWLEHEVTGLRVPEQDVGALARAMERLLTDTEFAARLGQNGLERVQQRYSLDRYIDRLEAYLR